MGHVGEQQAGGEIAHVGHHKHGQDRRERRTCRIRDVPRLGHQKHQPGHGETRQPAENCDMARGDIRDLKRRIAPDLLTRARDPHRRGDRQRRGDQKADHRRHRGTVPAPIPARFGLTPRLRQTADHQLSGSAGLRPAASTSKGSSDREVGGGVMLGSALGTNGYRGTTGLAAVGSHRPGDPLNQALPGTSGARTNQSRAGTFDSSSM
jgi:hypothetical protein